MTFDEIKEIYHNIGPVGLKLCADRINTGEYIYQFLNEIPDALPYVNNPVSLWRGVLLKSPHLFHLCPIVDEFNGTDWAVLVGIQPALANVCPWDIIQSDGFVWLWERQPQFFDAKYLDRIEQKDWPNLLMVMPQLKHDPRINWEVFTSYNWFNMIMKSIEFFPICPWERLTALHWRWLLRDNQVNYSTLLQHFHALPRRHKEMLYKEESALRVYSSNIFKKKNNNEN